MQSNHQSDARRRGVAIIYVSVVIVLLMAVASLAVDLARVRLAKMQFQGAADAAARAASGEIPNGLTAVQNKAISIAAANSANGSSVTITTSDVALGVWNSSSKTFTVTNTNPNAVRITIQRTASAGNAIPLLFGRLMGQNTCDVHTTSIAMLTGTTPVRVPGWANLWLAGMANGNYGGADVSGTAPQNSPVQVTSIPITAGGTITLQVSGSCADDPININKAWTPDGCSDGTGIRTNDSGYLNGMSNLTSQQGALIGVFLNNNAPTSGSTPAALNQSTPAAMDYTTLAPALKQPFFIGDGKKNNTGAQQTITVPAGATRLYLGMHDNINWNNNSGYLLVTFNGSGAAHVVTVK